MHDWFKFLDSISVHGENIIIFNAYNALKTQAEEGIIVHLFDASPSITKASNPKIIQTLAQFSQGYNPVYFRGYVENEVRKKADQVVQGSGVKQKIVTTIKKNQTIAE